MASKISSCGRIILPISPWTLSIASAILEPSRWKSLKCRPARIWEKMILSGLLISTIELPRGIYYWVYGACACWEPSRDREGAVLQPLANARGSDRLVLAYRQREFTLRGE